MLNFSYETSEIPPAPYIDLQVSAPNQSEVIKNHLRKLKG